MTAAVAVRDTISTPRATASAARKASRMFTRGNATSAIKAACTTVIPVPVVRRTLPIIMMEPVMHAGMGSRQATANAVPKAIRIIITASATSAITAACTTVTPVPVVLQVLRIIIMEPVMHAGMGIRRSRQATASAAR